MKVRELARFVRDLLDPGAYKSATSAVAAYKSAVIAECPICGYVGRFAPIGTVIRFGAGCPSCGSAERHRLLVLALRAGAFDLADKRVLHFAPETYLADVIEQAKPQSYVTGDILPGRAQRVLNIENLDLEPQSFDLIMCSHVLEHVDDRKALLEMHRVLADDGRLVLLVPLVEGWSKTYQNPDLKTDLEKQQHYGQADHIRFYGADFRDRVTEAGFALDEFTAEGADSIRYGLMRGEKVFIAKKIPAAANNPH